MGVEIQLPPSATVLLTPRAKRVEATLLRLRKRCRELQIFLSADGRVCERDAAKLLDVHVDTLPKYRRHETGPIWFRRPLRGSRISYALDDLAFWLVEGTILRSSWSPKRLVKDWP
jgi:hypothetical protein